MLLQPVGDRPQPGRDRLHQQVRGVRRMQPRIDLAFHLFINVRQAADFAVAPSLKDRYGRVAQNGLHKRVHGPVEKVLHMFFDNALHDTGVHKIPHFLPEGTDLFVDPAAVGKSSGDRKFRLRPGDHDRFREDLPAPVAQLGHFGDAAREEKEFGKTSVLSRCLRLI